MSSAAGVKFNLILRIRGVEFNQKTLVPQLIETVTAHNSFECTYILELTIQGGDPDYLRWVEEKTE